MWTRIPDWCCLSSPLARAADRAQITIPASDCDDDLAACAPVSEVPDGLGDLAQRERSVDDGRDRAGLEELVQRLQVLLALGRDPRAQLLTHERREQVRPELAIDASEPASGPFSSDDHERPLGGEGAPEVRQLTVPRDVEDDVVAVVTVGEVLAGVV